MSSNIIQFGDRALLLKRSQRRSLALHVYRDGRVEIRAPLRCPVALIRQFLGSREAWLHTQLNKFSGLPQPWRPEYTEGAVFLWMGASLEIKFEEGARPGVRLEGGALHIVLASVQRDPVRVESLLRRWMMAEAKVYFERRMKYWWGALPWLADGRSFPLLRVRAMKRQWGSCSSRGSINLNMWLMCQTVEAIDYVIVHELCHLLEMNHSGRFYAHLERAMPDWKLYKKMLSAGNGLSL